MSDTPRTDAGLLTETSPRESWFHVVKTSRQLERENAALREEAALWKEGEAVMQRNAWAWKDRAERAEAELAKLRQHAEAMFNWITGDGEYCAIKECEACAIGRAYRADFPEGTK